MPQIELALLTPFHTFLEKRAEALFSRMANFEGGLTIRYLWAYNISFFPFLHRLGVGWFGLMTSAPKLMNAPLNARYVNARYSTFHASFIYILTASGP